MLSKNNIVVGWIARRAQCELAGLVHAYVNWKFCVLSNIYFKVNTQGREQRARVLLKTYFNPRISPFTGEIEILLFSITPKNIPHHPVCLVGILIFKLTTHKEHKEIFGAILECFTQTGMRAWDSGNHHLWDLWPR